MVTYSNQMPVSALDPSRHHKGSTCASHEALMWGEQTPWVIPDKWEDMSHFFSINYEGESAGIYQRRL